jgi:hypothetical protein
MLKLGINKCSNSEYHADNHFLSSSNYKLLLKDPKQFHKEKILGLREPQEERAAFTEGSLTHSVILEPDLVKHEYAFYEGLRKAGEDYERFAAANKGRQIISKPQRIRVESYKEAYRKNQTAQKLLQGGEPEQTICTELFGIPTKVRFDYINMDEGYIADIKTSSYPADADTFRLTCSQFGYQLSAALYTAVASKFYNKEFVFYFVVISKKDLVCEVYKASESFMSKGLDDVVKAGKIYKQCKETGLWELQKINKRITEEIQEV